MATLSYTKFLWNSGSNHGIHSPFVYSIVTKCFYSGTPLLYHNEKALPVKNISVGSANILHKITAGLKPSKLFVLGEDAAEITELLRISGEKVDTRPWFFSTLAPIPGAVDLAYISGEDTETVLALLEQILPNANETTMCIVGNIHTTEKTEKAWQAIKENPNVTVTIDTYHLGLVFFRRTQAKQHFVVRHHKNIFRDALLGIRNLWGMLA